MGVDTQVYFTNRVSVSELVSAIETEFNTTVDVSRIRHEKSHYEGGFDRDCGYLSFNGMNFHFYPYNHICGGERDGTNPDTLSAYEDPDRYEAIKRITSYFGGYVMQNDCSGEEEFIPKTKGAELTPEQKLREIIYGSVGFKDCEKIITMIKDNLDFIKTF